MEIEFGILAALAALVFWGFGDFLIAKSTRKFGVWETLFVITIIGTLMLTPFVYNDITQLLSFGNNSFFLMLGVSVVLLVAALFDFEALKKGKIAVVEPVMAFEVPISAILAFVVINEVLDFISALLIAVLMAGLVMVSLRSIHFSKKVWLEKGVVLALLGALFMGTSNFLVGFASRITNPLLANWFIDVFLAVVSLFYLIRNKRFDNLMKDIVESPRLILTVSIFDNLAWISFAIAASLVPVAIAVGISESYIALSALLGILINKEKLLLHQKTGLVVAITSAVAIAFLYA